MDGGREEREGEGERYGWWERERERLLINEKTNHVVF